VRSGVSLHIGVDRLDATHYGLVRPLRGAERDARSMAQLAEAQAFERRVVVVGDAATVESVRREIARAAGRLRPGDTFLMTFAGYGGAVPDLAPGQPDAARAIVRTLCLFDQQLILPLLLADLARMRAGVQIILVDDSSPCLLTAGEDAPTADARALPSARAIAIARQHQLTYDAWQAEARAGARGAVPNPVIVLGACHAEQEAREDAYHGRFTSALLTVWNGGRYLQQPQPTYLDLLERVADVLADPMQTPRLTISSAAAPADESHPQPRFAAQRPFALEG